MKTKQIKVNLDFFFFLINTVDDREKPESTFTTESKIWGEGKSQSCLLLCDVTRQCISTHTAQTTTWRKTHSGWLCEDESAFNVL